jgi:hypothetical protein
MIAMTMIASGLDVSGEQSRRAELHMKTPETMLGMDRTFQTFSVSRRAAVEASVFGPIAEVCSRFFHYILLLIEPYRGLVYCSSFHDTSILSQHIRSGDHIPFWSPV